MSTKQLTQMRSVRRFLLLGAGDAGGRVVDLGGRADQLLAMQIASTVRRRFRLKLDSCQNSSSFSSSTTSHGTTHPAHLPNLVDICIYIAPAPPGGSSIDGGDRRRSCDWTRRGEHDTDRQHIRRQNTSRRRWDIMAVLSRSQVRRNDRQLRPACSTKSFQTNIKVKAGA